jgi:Bacterial TSP3 repeat
MIPSPLNAAIVLFVVATCPLVAQVTVNGTGSFQGAPVGTTFTRTYTLATPLTTKVLVVGMYNDNGNGISGMTFDGVAATRFSGQTRAAVGAYIFPGAAPTTVTIVGTVNTAAAPNAGFYIYELGGVDTSGGAAAIDAGTGSSITTTGADKFVVNFKAINAGPAGQIPAGTSIIPGANAGVFNAGGGGGGTLGYGYGVSGPTAGAKTLGWSVGGDGEVSLAFVQAGDLDLDDDSLTDTWELGWDLITDLTQLNGLITTPSGTGNGSGDWDGDGFTDSAEFNGGVNSSDPTNAASVPGDIDGDSFSDAAENAAFGNLSQTPGGDYDGDRATNAVEVAAGTSPTNAALWPDIEPDGMSDAWEAANGMIVGTDDSASHADADGFTNLQEYQAGTDPQDAAWAPGKSKLAHRWSFTGDLTDSAGGSNAQITNDTPVNAGLTSTQNPTSVALLGGGKATSDYVNLGSNLLSGLQSGGVKPVTIELWATQDAVQNWSRMFDFGVNDGINPSANESLRMTWSQGTDTTVDQISWEPTAAFGAGNAPYVTGAPFHVVMTIEPAAFTNGAIASGARVTWYSAPAAGSQAAGHPLYGAKGTFNTGAGTDLRALIDSACTLGRSMYPDNTASATYDEVRIWKGALSETERELFQLLGPDDMDRTDSEPDGFPDAWEIARFGNLTTATAGVDSDGDGENDEVEFAAESHPNDILSTGLDSDKDNLADTWERQYFRNLLQNGADDPDSDFSDNEAEEFYGTIPNNANSSPDTDLDGIPDGWELNHFPDLATADSDLRPGGVNTNFDGDFDNDRQEFVGGFDPLEKFSGRDVDNGGPGDGLPDYWEYFYFGDPVAPGYVGPNYLNLIVPSQDYEPDGATNVEEFADGTDPADGNDFRDSNADGFYDGILLAATDGFGATSFNAGTNWPGAVAPVAGKSYLVAGGLVLRTPNVANQTTVFAGARLALASSQFLLKGANSIAQANYVFDGVTVRNGEDAGQPITVAGTVRVVDPSTLFGDNGTIIVSAKVSGSGDLILSGNATAQRQLQFTNATNDWTGDLTMNPTASLVVNGVLNPGTSSVYNIRPGAAGVTNSIGGTGTVVLAGTMNLDLSTVVVSNGATWPLVTTAAASYDAGFTVADAGSLAAGFTADAGAVGARLWTSGDGDYQFDEATGTLAFIGTLPGYTAWTGTEGLTVGLNDGEEQNPDFDGFNNILEYQLGGDPLGFNGGLVTATENLAGTHLVFTFERFDASETDSTMTFRWGTSLATWNSVPLVSGTDGNGVIVTVTEDGGATADYDLIEVQVPKANAASGRLFGQVRGTRP